MSSIGKSTIGAISYKPRLDDTFINSRGVINETNFSDYMETRLGKEFLDGLLARDSKGNAVKSGINYELWQALKNIKATNGKYDINVLPQYKQKILSLFNRFHIKFFHRDLSPKHIKLVLRAGMGHFKMPFLNMLKDRPQYRYLYNRFTNGAEFTHSDKRFDNLSPADQLAFGKVLARYFSTGEIPVPVRLKKPSLGKTGAAKKRVQTSRGRIYGSAPAQHASRARKKPQYAELFREFSVLFVEECIKGSKEDKLAFEKIIHNMPEQRTRMFNERFLAKGIEVKLRDLNASDGAGWEIVPEERVAEFFGEETAEKMRDCVMFVNPNNRDGFEFAKKSELMAQGIKRESMEEQVFGERTMSAALFKSVFGAALKQIKDLAAFQRAQMRLENKYGADIVKETLKWACGGAFGWTAAGEVVGGAVYGAAEFIVTVAEASVDPGAIPGFIATIASRKGLKELKGEFLQKMYGGDTFDKAAYITLNVLMIVSMFRGAAHSIRGARSAKLAMKKLRGKPEMYSLIVDGKKEIAITKEQAVAVLMEHQKGNRNLLGKIEIHKLNPDGTIKPAPMINMRVKIKKAKSAGKSRASKPPADPGASGSAKKSGSKFTNAAKKAAAKVKNFGKKVKQAAVSAADQFNEGMRVTFGPKYKPAYAGANGNAGIYEKPAGKTAPAARPPEKAAAMASEGIPRETPAERIEIVSAEKKAEILAKLRNPEIPTEQKPDMVRSAMREIYDKKIKPLLDRCAEIIKMTTDIPYFKETVMKKIWETIPKEDFNKLPPEKQGEIILKEGKQVIADSAKELLSLNLKLKPLLKSLQDCYKQLMREIPDQKLSAAEKSIDEMILGSVPECQRKSVKEILAKLPQSILDNLNNAGVLITVNENARGAQYYPEMNTIELDPPGKNYKKDFAHPLYHEIFHAVCAHINRFANAQKKYNEIVNILKNAKNGKTRCSEFLRQLLRNVKEDPVAKHQAEEVFYEEVVVELLAFYHLESIYPEGRSRTLIQNQEPVLYRYIKELNAELAASKVQPPGSFNARPAARPPAESQPKQAERPAIELSRGGIGADHGSIKPPAVAPKDMRVDTRHPADPTSPPLPGGQAGFARPKPKRGPDKAKKFDQNAKAGVKGNLADLDFRWEELLKESRAEYFETKYPKTSKKLDYFSESPRNPKYAFMPRYVRLKNMKPKCLPDEAIKALEKYLNDDDMVLYLELQEKYASKINENDIRRYILKIYEQEKSSAEGVKSLWDSYDITHLEFDEARWISLVNLSTTHGLSKTDSHPSTSLFASIFGANPKDIKEAAKYPVTLNYASDFTKSITGFEKSGYPRTRLKSLLLELFNQEKRFRSKEISEEQFEIIRMKIHIAIFNDCAETSLKIASRLNEVEAPKFAATAASVKNIINSHEYPYTKEFLMNSGKDAGSYSAGDYRKIADLMHLDAKIKTFNLAYNEITKLQNMAIAYGLNRQKISNKHLRDLLKPNYDKFDTEIYPKLEALSKNIYKQIFDSGIFPEHRPDVASLFAGEVLNPFALEYRIKELHTLPSAMTKELQSRGAQIIFYPYDKGINESFNVRRRIGAASEQTFKSYVATGTMEVSETSFHETGHLIFNILQEQKRPSFAEITRDFRKLWQKRITLDESIKAHKAYEESKEFAEDLSCDEAYNEMFGKPPDVSVETVKPVAAYTYYFKGTIDKKPVKKILLDTSRVKMKEHEETELFADIFELYYTKKCGRGSVCDLREYDSELFDFFEKLDKLYRNF